MNSAKPPLSFATELRHLPAANRHQLVGLLDSNENWKTLAAVLRNPDRPDELLLKATNVSLLEEQRKRPGGSPSAALLEYWGTYGMRRHTFREAINFLEQCGLHRAADLISKCIESSESASEKPRQESAPTFEVDTCFFAKKEKLDEGNWGDLPEYSSFASSQLQPTAPNQSLISFSSDDDDKLAGQSIELDSSLTIATPPPSGAPILFQYRDIERSTDYFSSKHISQNGTKLGEGSFGEVFRCTAALLRSNAFRDIEFVAVKRFKQMPIGNEQNSQKSGQFLSELNTMCRLQHPNLVRLFGYSYDGPHLCIVTEYLTNGSLQEYLIRNSDDDENLDDQRGRLERSISLSFAARSQIALDVANALVYLHEYVQIDERGNRTTVPYIHRDVKSANIFLDERFRARLGDLGLVRQGSCSNTATTVVTSTIIGTSVYMAPEAFRGDVSVKIDTFSFGVVLFELLTGMSAFDSSREESDIVSYLDLVLGDEFDKLPKLENGSSLVQYIEDSNAIFSLNKVREIFDRNNVNCNFDILSRLVILAKCCIIDRKKNRPTMSEVLSAINVILNF